jgi:hypothetical protein
MPPRAGSRWLAEADSYLFEIGPQGRKAATRNYLITAPLVIMAAWARQVSGLVFAGDRRPRRRPGDS